MLKIIHNDCIKAMKKMENNSFDLVITSPPYNIGINYNSYKDNKHRDEYHEWLKEVFTEIFRVTSEDGSFFLNVGATNVNPWLAYEVAKIAESVGFTLQNSIIWIKSVSVGDTTYGHFKPINSERFLNNTYENLFHFTKTGKVGVDRKSIGVPYMDKSNISRWNTGEDKRCKGNTWFIPYETITNRGNDRGGHPATFPTRLVEDCIKMTGAKKVLDPFLGTGTTLLACKNLDVEGVGIELDAVYVEVSKERIK